jgi:uncharacterized damage-inducible protein DinB
MMNLPDPVRLLAGDLDEELTRTRALLEVVPEGKLTWRPHERSWTLGHLVGHLINVPVWQATAMAETSFDLAAAPPPEARGVPASLEEILATFDANASRARAALEALDAGNLDEPWTLSRGGTALFTQPRSTVLRTMGINHLVHHRAQLGVYLRLLDVPLPWLYGPTADAPGPG